MPTLNQKPLTALVTGATSGLGKETARRIIGEGGQASLWDLDAGQLKKAAAAGRVAQTPGGLFTLARGDTAARG